jgi:hydrogenase-4 component E
VTPAVNLLVALAMGLNLLALGTSRLPMLIKTVSAQGVVLGVLPVMIGHEPDWRVSLLAIAAVGGKGMVIPWLLRRAMRTTQIDREIEPFVGYVPSLLLGAGGAILAVAFTPRLPLLPEHADSLLLPAALAAALTGLILLTGRTTAIAQVCGYLILENGIYLFGLMLVEAMPLLVESGILLDVTVGVFVIGIIVDRIQRAFDSLDTRKLVALRE